MKVEKFRLTAAVLITAAAVRASLELQRYFAAKATANSGWEIPVAILLFFLSIAVGYVSSGVLTDRLVRIRWVRQRLLGHQWIEGVWLFDVYESGEWIRYELAHINYRVPSLELSVQTVSFREGIGDFQSSSRNIVLREDLSYINYFDTQDNPGTVVGLAVGKFMVEHGASHPTSYRGELVYLDTTPRRTEQAMRIPESQVIEFQEKFGANWQQEIARALRPHDTKEGGAGERLLVTRAVPEDIREVEEIARLAASSTLSADVAAIEGALVAGYTLQNYEHFLDESDFFFVARRGGVILGFLLGYSSFRIPSLGINLYSNLAATLQGENYVLVDQVCVRRSQRGKGIGRSLYVELFRQTQHRDVVAGIVTGPENRASVAFHRSLGFRSFGKPFVTEHGEVSFFRREVK